MGIAPRLHSFIHVFRRMPDTETDYINWDDPAESGIYSHKVEASDNPQSQTLEAHRSPGYIPGNSYFRTFYILL